MSAAYDFDLVCIGSGPAGQRAAVQAAKLGHRAAVIEKRRCVGGVCIDTGTIPSKTLRETVLMFSGLTGRADRLPWTRVDSRPTAAQLFTGVDAVIAREVEVVERQLRRNDVTLLSGEASFVDPHTLAVHGEGGRRHVSGANIVIAIGTEPAATPGVEADGAVILNTDQVVQLKHLPRSMTVVGAGVIGIEYTSIFATLGVAVTLVERRDRPLEFLDREIVDELIHQMRNRNVTFRFGEAVEALAVAEGPPRKAVVTLESGKRIVSDMVLFSVGRVAATDALNLSAAGLAGDARGRIKVDERFRTAVPHIFAAGDVIGYPSLAATSSEQGRLAACHAFGVEAGPMARHFPIGIYSIPEISMVGAPEHELTAHKVPYETGVARYREIARGQILGDDSGMFKMLFHREDRRLLGIHCIGTGATELVHVGQAVLGLGGGLDYFLQTVFNYPTLAECYKVAALDASNK
ncbi:MAG TPA: Si-specific NAD(P)(+) transhydrogenase, partial [Gemmatimonadales bacterium]